MAVRWLTKLPRPNDAAVGALVLALTKAGSKRLVGVHLVYVNAAGKPVPAWNGADKNKNTEGTVGEAVGVLGALDGATGINVTEGLADTLAIASRDPQPTVAMMGTHNHRNADVARWLAGRGHVRIWADPRKPGQDAARDLNRGILYMGGSASIVQPGEDHDPGASGGPFGVVDMDELGRYAGDLVRDGYPSWDAERLASTMITERGGGVE